LAGILGGYEGYKTAKSEGRSTETAIGAAGVRGGFATAGTIGGAALMSWAGPLGVAVGGIVGGIIGDWLGKSINKYLPGISKSLGSFFTGFADAFVDIKKVFMDLKETAWNPMIESITGLGSAIANMLSGPEAPLGGFLTILKDIGFIIGQTLLFPLRALAAGFRIAADIIGAVADLLHGNFQTAWNKFKDMLITLIDLFVSPFKAIYNKLAENTPTSPAVGPAHAMGGLITGQGMPTSDNILTPTSPGEYVMNARSTEQYGLAMMNQLNAGTYTSPPPAINNNIVVNMDRLEQKLDQVVATIANMQVSMDGTAVGKILVNNSQATSVGVFRAQSRATF
jgi:hypothetical protein